MGATRTRRVRGRTNSAHGKMGSRAASGMSLLLLPFALLVLIGFVSFGVDIGWIRAAEKQLEVAADAAALASAQYLPNDQNTATQIARDVALANRAAGVPVQLAGSDIVFGLYSDGQFTATNTLPNAVKITTRRTTGSPNGALPLFFARIFGHNTANVQRQAIAANRGPASVVLLHPTMESLKDSGNGNVRVGGSIYVNSTHSKAMSSSGNGVLRASSFEVTGGVYKSGDAQIIGLVFEGVPPIPDPLANLPVPVLADHTIRKNQKYSISSSGSFTLEPGRYKGGIDISGEANVTFLPGIYIIEGGGLKISDQGPVTMNEVMIYNTGTNDTTSNADQMTLSGNGSLTWTPPTSGTYQGISFFQKRTLADKKVQISGNGQMSITGAVYSKAAEVQISGNGGTLGAGLIASSMEISGNGDFDISAWPGGMQRSLLVK